MEQQIQQEITPILQPDLPAPGKGRFSSSTPWILGGLASSVLFVIVLAALGVVDSVGAVSNNQVAAASASISPFSDLQLLAKGVYVYDISEQRVLFEQNADAQLPLASITKVPLVLAVAEVLVLDDTVVVSRGAVERGEGGGLGTGDTWRVGDLIDFTLAVSSNAGAEVLAEAADSALRAKYPQIPEDEAASVWRMNKGAKALDLESTYFLNPSGMDLSPTQAASMSTAREAAMLMVEAAKTPALFTGTTQLHPVLGPLNGSSKETHNTNEALADIPGLVIGKTGFTDLAGGNLAVVFEIAPGHRIVAVVLGSSYDGRFEDMRRIMRIIGEQARNL